jgi:hypothetical protein
MKMKNKKLMKVEEKKDDKKRTLNLQAGEKEKVASILVCVQALLAGLSPEGQLAFLCLFESNNVDLIKKKIELFKD